MTPDFTTKDDPAYRVMSRGQHHVSVISPKGERLARVLNVSTNQVDPAYGNVPTLTIVVTGYAFEDGPPPEHVLKAFGLKESDYMRDGVPILAPAA